MLIVLNSLLEGTPFEGGMFQCKIVLGSDFPAKPPKGLSPHYRPGMFFIFLLNILFAGYFVTKIFHPNISKTGDICVNTLKKVRKLQASLLFFTFFDSSIFRTGNPSTELLTYYW